MMENFTKLDKLLKRNGLFDSIRASLEAYPVVALLGPRQSGKTTLARQIIAALLPGELHRLNFLDLEDPTTLARLDDPKLTLEALRGLVVIDEIQRLPTLFPVLRVLADRPSRPATFLILGSASRELVQQSSESLAGRVKYIDVMPFGLNEVGRDALRKLWLRGGYPLSFLASGDVSSDDWRAQYVRTFLEQDLPALGIRVSPTMMRRLWMMLCHFHGQILNTSDIAKSLDISDTTAKKYIDILCSTFVLRRLEPWFENIGKRQVKSPKIYFRDSGLLHQLLGVKTETDLSLHPALGRSWEGFVLEQVVRQLGVRQEDAFFWAVHSQGELDLLVGHGAKRRAFEIKYTTTPKITSSVNLALKSLALERLDIVYPGDVSFPLSNQVGVLSVADFFGSADG